MLDATSPSLPQPDLLYSVWKKRCSQRARWSNRPTGNWQDFPCPPVRCPGGLVSILGTRRREVVLLGPEGCLRPSEISAPCIVRKLLGVPVTNLKEDWSWDRLFVEGRDSVYFTQRKRSRRGTLRRFPSRLGFWLCLYAKKLVVIARAQPGVLELSPGDEGSRLLESNRWLLSM